jgi:FKBP-type peptidyl-prolyl cis-trans isomerase FkpA
LITNVSPGATRWRGPGGPCTFELIIPLNMDMAVSIRCCTTILACFVTATLLGGCGDAAERRLDGAADQPAAPAVASPEVTRTYAPELNVDLTNMTRLESGLYIQDLQEGAGEALEAGQTALVQYTGWLPDGTLFDSSRQPGRQPFDVVVGRGEVIEGWDQGLPGMRVGGRRLLVIPPTLGYGAEGAGGVIPPNATLVFDVELVEVRRTP